MASTKTISDDLMKLLIFRYLQESGLTDSSFLGSEAGIDRCSLDDNLVLRGSLVTLVQKGLQYMKMEANLNDSDADMDEDFSFIQPMDLLTKDANELRQMVKENRRKFRKDREKEVEKEHDRNRKRGRDDRRLDKGKGHVKDGEGKEKDENTGKMKNVLKFWRENEEKLREGAENPVHGFRVPKPTNIYFSTPPVECEVSTSDVTILEGHTSEVCACAWSSLGLLLASGSWDSTARIWTINRGSRSQNGSANVVVLEHSKGKWITSEKADDVITLDWNGEGALLATGSYDGQARIWNTNGDLMSTLFKNYGPIYCLKWSKNGDYLFTGSHDKTAIVWDVKTEKPKQEYGFLGPARPGLHVDWRSNVSFATCSTDNRIYVCNVEEKFPVKAFIGHEGKINCLKWNPTGTLLASCSDDLTIKLWSMKHMLDMLSLRGHSEEVCTIRWSPTGPGTNNPNKQLVLASASLDSTVKLWDVQKGKIQLNLIGHRGPVNSIEFSPNGNYIASGSSDKSLRVWSLKEAKIVKTFSGNGSISGVCWNREGDKIAAGFMDNTVCVMDFRM